MIGRSLSLLIPASLVGTFLLSAPAMAQAGLSIPEPSDVTLLGMGLAGLVIGRWAARRKPDE